MYQVVPWDPLGTYSKFVKLLKSNKHKFLIHFLFTGTLPDLIYKYNEKPMSLFFLFKMHLLMVWLSLVHNDIHHEIFSSVIAYVPETLPSAYLIYFSPRDNLNLTQ